jgi:biopolymer transport protein ExbD
MPVSLPNVKRRARIEIIPLIDVVFFLLATFVMVSMSMVRNQGLSVHLPQAATASPETRTSSVTVTITESGDVYLNKEKMPLEDLTSRLSAMKSDPDLKVFINGDEHAYFGQAVEMLDEIRSLGIHKVSIQTKRKK